MAQYVKLEDVEKLIGERVESITTLIGQYDRMLADPLMAKAHPHVKSMKQAETTRRGAQRSLLLYIKRLPTIEA